MIILHEHEKRNAIEFEDFHNDQCLEIEVPPACYQDAVQDSYRIIEQFSTLRYVPCREAIQLIEATYVYGDYTS